MASDDDLINFEVGSPDFPQNPLTTLLQDETSSATLLDSELNHLEETLQTASTTPSHSRSRSDSVELEQILITIDDDNVRQGEIGDLVLENALEKLDRIINESTNTTNRSRENVSLQENISIEECLKDLDNYLQEFDTSGTDLDPDLDNSVLNQISLQDKLRRLVNRSKSLRIGQQNFGYEADNSSNFSRNNLYRNTIETKHPNKNSTSSVNSDENISNRKKISVCVPVSNKNNNSTGNHAIKRPLSVNLDDASAEFSNNRFSFCHFSQGKICNKKRPQSADLDNLLTFGNKKRAVSANLDKLMDHQQTKTDLVSAGNDLFSPSDFLGVEHVPEPNLEEAKRSQSPNNFVNGYFDEQSSKSEIRVCSLDGFKDPDQIKSIRNDRYFENLCLAQQNCDFNDGTVSKVIDNSLPNGQNERVEFLFVRKEAKDYQTEQFSDDFSIGSTCPSISINTRPKSANDVCTGQILKLVHNNNPTQEIIDNRQKSMNSRDIKFDIFSISNNNSDLTENLARTKLRKSLGTLTKSKENNSLNRSHKFRSTIGRIPFSKCSDVADNLENGNSGQITSENLETDEEDDIDWSWVEDVTSEDVSRGDNTESISEETVTESEESFHSIPDETPQMIDIQTNNSIEVLPSSSDSTNLTQNSPSNISQTIKDEISPTWLRSSMRRLHHFNLPSSFPPPLSVPDLIPPNPVSQPVVLNRDTIRPVSAPVAIARTRSESESSRSRNESRARSLSSSESSLDSVESRDERHEGGGSQESGVQTNPVRSCDSTAPPTTTMPESSSPLGQWPHGLSSMLACLGCTLGLFNLSRFATLTVRFGANFIIQFLILSLIFGIPLFTLQLCLGQQLGAGVVDMWRISPLFQGVGIALLAAQALVGLYSIVGVSWMFIYFRDSFITKQDQYKWAEPYESYREDSRSGLNGTYKISETVPDYFNGVVLQRHNLVTGNSFGAIKFQVAFNLAVVWMIVFVSLSKGLRSYAKVVYVFSLLPIFGTFVLCAKLLGMSPTDSFHEIFPATAWGEFFVNTKSWIAASQEAFLTWGLLGASVMQISSHNKHKHLLQRDSSLVIILTITILMLTAFLANTCIEILHAYGYSYVPNSFERISTYVFLRSNKDPLPPSLSSTPVRYMTHSSFIIGEKVIRPGMDKTMESGYQVLRFATELVPATLAILGPTQISPFWAVLFYFVLILFGIAQQLAIWHCVITGIMAIKAKVLKSWETTITFFTCTFGFILGLPMTTEFGIFVVYFLDYCVGGTWWLLFVYLLQIVAVFMIRGRPYSGDTVVTALFTPSSGSCMQAWAAPLLSFIWNVILPVALMVVCITQFKSGNFRELFIWHHAPSLEYWPTWSRQIGSLLQLMPILCVPIVAIVQSYRYLNNGPPDILERIQLLYRPPLDSEHLDDLTIQQTASTTATAVATTNTNIPAEDPPPKYTPPPSYTTATGARIAKMLRQSIRRSVRRIANVFGEGSQTRVQERPQLQVPPPDYCTVLVEMNQSQTTSPHVAVDVTDSQTGSQNGVQSTQSERISRELSTLQTQGSPLTAADVASILRSSFRRSTIRTAQRARRSAPEEIPSGSLSAECLVDGIAPLGEDSLVLETIRMNEESKTADDNRSSVI